MPRVLTRKQIAHYEEQGFLAAVPVLTAEEVEAFRGAVEKLEAALGAKLKRIDNCHHTFRWAWDLTTRPAVLDVMEDLLGPDLYVHSSRVFYKHPHDPSYVSWHQDGTYSDLNSKPAPSAWIALTPSVPENGCVRVIPGSHRHDKLPHVETYAEDNLLNHGEVVAVDVDEGRAVDLVLAPGEMSLHHVNTIHGSKPNRSDLKRIGFAVSYITPAVPHSHLPVIHARGSRRDHPFELLAGPPDLDFDAALAAHLAAVRDGRLGRVRVA